MTSYDTTTGLSHNKLQAILWVLCGKDRRSWSFRENRNVFLWVSSHKCIDYFLFFIGHYQFIWTPWTSSSEWPWSCLEEETGENKRANRVYKEIKTFNFHHFGKVFKSFRCWWITIHYWNFNIFVNIVLIMI